MPNYVTITSDKSKTVALLLCLFFGLLSRLFSVKNCGITF